MISPIRPLIAPRVAATRCRVLAHSAPDSRGPLHGLHLALDAPDPFEQIVFLCVRVRHTHTPYTYMALILADAMGLRKGLMTPVVRHCLSITHGPAPPGEARRHDFKEGFTEEGRAQIRQIS